MPMTPIEDCPRNLELRVKNEYVYACLFKDSDPDNPVILASVPVVLVNRPERLKQFQRFVQEIFADLWEEDLGKRPDIKGWGDLELKGMGKAN